MHESNKLWQLGDKSTMSIRLGKLTSSFCITFFSCIVYQLLRDHTFMTSTQEWGLEICHLFVDSFVFKQ